jgi:hypothetical protein
METVRAYYLKRASQIYLSVLAGTRPEVVRRVIAFDGSNRNSEFFRMHGERHVDVDREIMVLSSGTGGAKS